jgi:hypothetical protein
LCSREKLRSDYFVNAKLNVVVAAQSVILDPDIEIQLLEDQYVAFRQIAESFDPESTQLNE